MGELVTDTVNGTLYFASRSAIDQALRESTDRRDRAVLFADFCRLNTLYMIATAGSGHIGSSFSSMDILAWLHLNELSPDNGVFLSSKGHDAPGLYSILIGLGRLPEEMLHKLRRLDGLPGHPDVSVSGVRANTGSLGMGISKAKGMAHALRLQGVSAKLYVLTGDGELQEGQIWESLISAANDGLSELTVIVDHNKIQSDYSVERTGSLGDLEAKFEAFGWRVERIDGHDIGAFERTLGGIEGDPRPKVIIADTVKGKGVSFMEGTSVDSDVELFRFHSGAPQENDYKAAAQEIIDRISGRMRQAGLEPARFEAIERVKAEPTGPKLERLLPAYTEAILSQAEANGDLVVLDADLQLDMGLVPFNERFPSRFFECGIAEMDMVSQAGGMALRGLMPVVHSFSCFLSARANEQIYNNATERTKILYVGGLAGVLPGGPGHSHQAVRDISSLGGIPDMVMVEPSHPDEVGALVDWCLNRHDGPSYLRLISLPYPAVTPPSRDWTPVKGQGRVLRKGRDVVFVTAGLVMLTEVMKAAETLEGDGIASTVINMPWLNVVDGTWLNATIRHAVAPLGDITDRSILVTVDNHYTTYGLGDAVISALAQAGGLANLDIRKIGLGTIPPSGGNAEVLEAVGLSASRIASTVRSLL